MPMKSVGLARRQKDVAAYVYTTNGERRLTRESLNGYPQQTDKWITLYL